MFHLVIFACIVVIVSADLTTKDIDIITTLIRLPFSIRDFETRITTLINDSIRDSETRMVSLISDKDKRLEHSLPKDFYVELINKRRHGGGSITILH